MNHFKSIINSPSRLRKGALLFLVLTISGRLYSQKYDFQDILEKTITDTIDLIDPSAFDTSAIIIPLKYGQRHLYPTKGIMPSLKSVHQVTMVFSAYPENYAFQKKLNHNRLIELFKVYPSLKNNKEVKWKWIIQNGCIDRACAIDLFHGFILESGTDGPTSKLANLEELTQLMSGDSTILKVLNRNEDWSKLLVVTDLTASMTPYTAQLLLWFKLNEKKQRIEYFVFFNDGNGKFTREKMVGSTGGVYGGKANSFESIANLAQTTISSGHGGDLPENDLEAILFGVDHCKDCEEIILIADNEAAPRDMALLKRIGKPVRVTLCGTENGINPSYLDVAYQTGGSVHTIEKDIKDLIKLSEGESIQIGKELFVIRNGKFVFLKKT